MEQLKNCITTIYYSSIEPHIFNNLKVSLDLFMIESSAIAGFGASVTQEVEQVVY